MRSRGCGLEPVCAHATGLLSRWLLGAMRWRRLWVEDGEIGAGTAEWDRLAAQARRCARAAIEEFAGVSLPAETCA